MSHRLLARRPGESGLSPCELADLDARAEAGSLLWLDVQSASEAELDELGARFGFAPAAIEDVLDVEQLPKLDDYGDHLFVVLHALIAASDRVDTLEVDCFIRPNLLVTVHAQPVVGLDWLWDAVQRYPHLAEHGADELFAQLAEVIGRRYLELLDVFEERVDTLLEPALDADKRVLTEIQTLRRDEVTIRRALRPQRVVLASLRSNPPPVVREGAQELLGDAFDVHNLVVASLAATRGLLTDTLETYRGASAERQAAATAVLTVYAAIVLPLSLITSWYGMNMTNLPGAGRDWGWWAVTAAMVTVAVVSWIWFVRVGIIRMSRGRTAVVSTLVGAARAPVRPITMLRESNRRTTPDQPSQQSDPRQL
ncbi:MAG: magnesium transporter CorA family protein [Actinomycetota bacterium]